MTDAHYSPLNMEILTAVVHTWEARDEVCEGTPGINSELLQWMNWPLYQNYHLKFGQVTKGPSEIKYQLFAVKHSSAACQYST